MKKGGIQLRLGDCPIKVEEDNEEDAATSADSASASASASSSSPVPSSVEKKPAEGADGLPMSREERDAAKVKGGFIIDMAEDVNKAGLRRAKKKSIEWNPSGKKQKARDVDMMEDTSVAVEIDTSKHADACIDSMVMIAVFDGHVGKNASLKGKTIFPTLAQTYFDEHGGSIGGEGGVHEMLTKMMRKIGDELSEFEYEGTTGTVVVMWKVGSSGRDDEGKYFVQAANVGDSVAFCYHAGEDGNGTVKARLSEEHRVVLKHERDRIIADGIEVSPAQTRVGGLSVSRSLGDHFLQEQKCGLIDLAFVSEKVEMDKHDSVVVASDGLWDVLSGHAVGRQLYREGEGKIASAHAIMSTALQAPTATDNITVVVGRIK
eukprot:CAMPEP_0113873994 /NCGR_PEP_ID=MMETSP0780_2-20120614/4083_1 /TAXON_ID=652834 /ORGANISM="Palpitomonas bilix" /LENGTH=375 /DNA_ID=CAMNT_0000859709 /DNA_START=34 /DNA_END=1161 /DNA_ORIENTATION=- /assembly_acc=CAM_ASM_000599